MFWEQRRNCRWTRNRFSCVGQGEHLDHAEFNAGTEVRGEDIYTPGVIGETWRRQTDLVATQHEQDKANTPTTGVQLL